MSEDVVSQLESFGATRAQLVDVATEVGPRVLPYLDFARAKDPNRKPVVFEVQGRPYAFLFDGRDQSNDVTPWVRHIAFRGDADWIGVLRPGRVDMFRAVLGAKAPVPVEGLAQGPFLFPSLLHVRNAEDAPGVRHALLTLLRQSIAKARAQGVAARDALSLVGRALFWRFLVDRNLLEGLDPAHIASGAKTWESCLDNKASALSTFDWLDRTFNGGLLAFSSSGVPTRIRAAVYQTVVGNIAHGATAEGQLQLKLPSDWREVNFSHVPVGLLSEVYEAFAHAENGEEAKAQSVFYTPRRIADFVVDEALAALEHVERPRVLDPAAGAGVFLVTAFRALVAREWARTGERPSRVAIRRILNQQLTGFDINEDALRLSELALYLTAIELDPEHRPRPLSLLRFDALRERALFPRDKATFGSLGQVESRFRGKFDLVVGNPPWTAKATSEEKRAWVKFSKDCVRERLGAERAAKFDLPDKNPDLPFVYRAMEWCKPSGSIALVTHARWCFGQSRAAIAARRDLLQSVHATGLLNGTGLRDSNVWPNVRHPFCLLFAVNEPPPQDATLQFISPDLEQRPDSLQDRMRIDWNSARDISIAEILKRPWSLKALFRGSSIDESVIDDIRRAGTPLGEYLRSLGTSLSNGYQVGGVAGRQQSAKALAELPDLRGTRPGFFVDAAALLPFSRQTVLFPRNRKIYSAPLLLVHESMKADHQEARASLAMRDLAYDERFSGASFANVDDGVSIAQYLQLVIQSSLFTHFVLFSDGQFGVEREVVHKETIESMPVVPWDRLPKSLRKTSVALSKRLGNGMTASLLTAIDTFVADTYELSDIQRESIADTLMVSLPTAWSKDTATRPSTLCERGAFARVCEESLVDLLDEHVNVRLVGDTGSGCPWHFLQINRLHGDVTAAETLSPDARTILEAADEASASLVTIKASDRKMLVGQLDQYRYWTKTRARLLASSLVSETLDGHA